jgi:hypothetical protein
VIPSWVPIAANLRCVGRTDENRVLARGVKEAVVRDSFSLSVFGWLVMAF